jgi:hypothetical protein
MKEKLFALPVNDTNQLKEGLKENQDIEHGDAKIAKSIKP